jgi:hypothetical protein
MHLLFQVLCFIFCSEIISYSNKTAESDAVFSKFSFLAIFAGNKIREKNTKPIFHVKKESEHRRDMRECSRPKRAWPTRQDSLATWGLLVRPSSVASPPAFAYAFLYIKKGVTYETEAIRETERRQSHNHQLWDQIDLGFLPRRRGSEAVFTAIISINHELHLHHHV